MAFYKVKLFQLKLDLVTLKIAVLRVIFGIFRLERKKRSRFDGNVEKLIRIIAKEYNVDPDLAVRIAWCESKFNTQARNTNPRGSVDRGLYQWNDTYHPEVSDRCADNVECATRRFCMAVKKGHLNWWNASKHCWSK